MRFYLLLAMTLGFASCVTLAGVRDELELSETVTRAELECALEAGAVGSDSYWACMDPEDGFSGEPIPADVAKNLQRVASFDDWQD
jgi:hypothetical protein